MKDCPEKPKTSENVRGKATLNMVGVIPSPQTSETEAEVSNIPLRVITRSQARNVEESSLDPDQGPKPDTEEPDKEMERKPRKRRQRTKRSKSKKSQENVPTPPKEDVVSNPIIHP